MDNAPDLGDKIREKLKKTSNFYFYVVLFVNVILMMMDHKIIWYFKRFSSLLEIYWYYW